MNGLLILIFKKKKLLAALTALFKKDAKSFGGVYNGILLICRGEQKRFKALDEFHQRLSYLEGYEELKKLLDNFYPAGEQSKKNLQKLACMIIQATEDAGITHSEKEQTIQLGDDVLHYNELENEELYVDDTVKVAIPAWTQGNLLLEKGYCYLKK